MAIIWIDIWDTQSSSKIKSIINQRFNVGSFIAMVYGANMNPGVLQCKNCWKWEHIAGVCYIQGAKCVRCNRLHLTEHHCHFAWCCKTNDKINPPRLETKKGEPCPHMFKCLNCKGDHQCCGNHLSQWTNDLQWVNLLGGYIVGSSQENSTRSLC